MGATDIKGLTLIAEQLASPSEIIAVIAIIASLIYVARQLTQTNTTMLMIAGNRRSNARTIDTGERGRFGGLKADSENEIVIN
jgi:hypothetical protein